MAKGAPKGERIMAKSDSPVAWYGRLDPNEKRTLWACFGGWTLNSLDFFIFTFALPAIVVALDMTRQQAGMITTLTLVASALGGWIAGILADRYGRVHVLQITILWFAVFGLLCAFVQDYWQLLTCRMLMGLGLGGEWAVGAVLLGEVIRAKDRGKAVGTMQSGWGIGWGIAALISIAILLKLRPDIAWRVLLSIGLLPALLIFYIRRHIHDAAVFNETQKKLRAKRRATNFLDIFSPSLIKTTILMTLLAAGAQGGYYASAWFLEALRNTRKIAAMATGRYLVAVIVGSIIGYLVSAYLNDRIGRRPTFIVFAICSAASIFALTLLAANDMSVLVLGFLLGLFASGMFSGLGPVMTENFPTALRGSGQSFSYNAARLLAAGVPGLISWLSERSSFNRTIDLIAIAAYGLVVIVAFLLPETKGKVLSASA
jgi:MFS family permease